MLSTPSINLKRRTRIFPFIGMAIGLMALTGGPAARAEQPAPTGATVAEKTLGTSGTSTKGVMFLATRGFARTTADTHMTNLEAETLHRQEFPYGASAGWKWVYQGYSDGTKDTVNILKAAVWVQQAPGEPLIRVPLTFNGGASDVVIAKDALQETDAISTEVKPGAVVWVTTWYRAGNGATGLPFQTLINTWESTPGAEDRDGTLAGPIGSLSDHTLSGGFNHTGVGPLNAGVPYCARGYRPMGAVGQPHPSFKGTEIVPLFIGDSINVQYIDVLSKKDDIYSMRGFNGRFCAMKYPYIVFGQGGSNSGGFLGATKLPVFIYILGDKGENKRRVTHLFNEYGINSVRMHKPPSEIAAFEWADRQKVAAVALAYGLPYIQSTLTPCELSSTAWWHKDPDAAKDADFAVFCQQRQAFNNMVRTQSNEAHLPGCIGFWDWNSVLETDPKAGSNLWVAAYKSDGIHPNSAGHAAGADTIPEALLVDHPNPIPVP